MLRGLSEREKLKKFVSLRQDLERVRNLCYMVSRREKLQKSFVKLREQIFEKQLDLVADDSNAQQMSLLEISALLEANHGPTVYDSLFSHADAERHTENDFEVIVSRISGEITENSAQIRKDNPYRKLTLPATIDSKKSWAYKRIFSDTSASEEDVLNNKLKGGLGPMVLKIIIDGLKLQKYVKTRVHWYNTMQAKPKKEISTIYPDSFPVHHK